MSKITNIEIHELGEGKPAEGAGWASTMILLKITTDDGYVGYGEAVPTLRVLPVIESLREVGRLYLHKDVFDVESNTREWYKHDFYLSESFESTTALSAFDIASWDIIGKITGTPLHRIIGGEYRSKVKMYSNGWYAGCREPHEFADRAKQWVSKGYLALKFDPFGEYYDYVDQYGLAKSEAIVQAVRESVGDSVDLLIEHHGRFNPNSAIMIARMLEKYSVLFAEEPVHPEDLNGLRKYRERTNIRVALGERIINLKQALLYLQNGLVDFLQADITNSGGVTGARKMAILAEAHGVEMAFHNAFGPVQNAVTLQLDAAIPNFLIQESFYDVFPDWKRRLIKNSTPVEGGHSSVPKTPGIGIEIDEAVLKERAITGQEYFNPDEPVWVVSGTWNWRKQLS